MTTWDLGDRVPLRHRVYDADSQLVDATITLTVIAPDGTITSPAVTHTSLGTYDASVLTSQVGQWRYTWSVSGAVGEDLVTDVFDVADPGPPLYLSLDKFKKALRIAPDDATRDEELLDVLDAACRGIEINTNRKQFWLGPTAVARTYRIADRVTRTYDGYILDLGDDIGSTVGMVVEIGSDASGWTAVTDYETGPDNALADGRPIEWLIRRCPWGAHWALQRVRVTARPGWPAVPTLVPRAVQLQGARLAARRDSAQGFQVVADVGAIRLGRLDPDVEALVEKFRKIPIG